MSVTSRAALAAAITLAALSPVAAQSHPNLSGTWVMVPEKSNFGPMPPIPSRTDVIEHKEPSLTVKRTQMMPDNNEVVSTLVYGIDGKPYKNTTGPNEVTSTLKWDGAVLVIESDVNSPNGLVRVVDRYTLSADQKTLTQERALSAGGQEVNMTFVLVKK